MKLTDFFVEPLTGLSVTFKSRTPSSEPLRALKAAFSTMPCHLSVFFPQVRVGKALISCPITECSGNLEEGLVISHLTKEEVAKYRYFLELSQLDSSTKPCPQCSQFTSLKTHTPNRSEQKYKVS